MNRLHVAMPCVGLGVPVVMVEADSLALPPLGIATLVEDSSQRRVEEDQPESGTALHRRFSQQSCDVALNGA
jgi:hypothetical protein